VWLDLLGALDAEPGRWDLTALRELGVGGAAAPPSMIRGFDRHGLTVVHLWGMTELSPVGTVSRPGPELDGADEEARFASRTRQGTASPMVEIRAIDDRGEAVPWDDETIGELEVRGPWVAAAYHGGRGSDKFSADGWFATGDVVTIDGAGSIRIRDRAKDLVKSGGEWISSVDLENELMAHPAVAAAAVIAVPDERWGERPAAAVVLRPGEAADADALREHLAAVYAKWQIPDRFVFVAEIPRTSTGKFDKRALRAQMAS
jgi:fatty-acyl-CoA synthase